MHLSKIILSSVAAALYTAAASAYTLNVRSGNLPSNVTTANLNGLQPVADGYKRGWSTDGWTVDRFGDRGYILVSPTYTKSDTPCANSLSLPAMDITTGQFLSWDARGAMPDFKESYIVTVREESASQDTAETVWEEKETPGEWTSHIADLSKYVGKRIVIEFRTVSVNKFLLCLDKVKVTTLTDYSFVAKRTSPVFFNSQDMADENVSAQFEVSNLGIKANAGVFECRIKGKPVASSKVEDLWETGETRNLRFALPAVADTRQTYEIVFSEGDSEELYLYEGEYFCTTFTPHLMVDKGTGTWCVNCPEANLTVAALEKRFGDSLVMLETHNNDVMANEAYFSELAYRSIPHWMLNRIQATSEGNTSKFDTYIFRPCEWGISLTAADNGNDKISVKGFVETVADVDNASDRYRIGYVLTKGYYEPANLRYRQSNGASQPSTEQYFYLPSNIPAPLMNYHNVTLTYETAFTGIPNSLSSTIKAGDKTSFSFDIPLPESLGNFDDTRVVTFILDTQSGEVLNSIAGLVGRDFTDAGVDDIVKDEFDSGCPSGVWDMQGRRISENIQDLPAGIYIINGKKVVK